MKDARPLLVLLRSGATAGALRTLLDRFDSAEAALAADPADWTQAGLGAAPAAALLNPDHAVIEADLEWLDGPARHLIGWHSPDYPMLLRSAVHPPAMLFVAGDPDLLWHPQVAVVGSRRPSAGGRDNARHFARVFGQRGMAVTSGLAEGIDTAAHQGAMETSRTVAVLGTGPDLCYPPGNRPLMEAIAESGAVVSEHPPGTGGKRQHFPSRNRLIAGLSLGTVVIEAAVRSGALITARMATDAGREVFALPGSIHNPMARGCHRLIRQGVALAESPEEVMEALSVLAASLSEALRGRLADGPAAAPVGKARRVGNAGADQPGNGSADRVGVGSTEEQAVLRSLGHDPVNIDQLCQRTGLTVGPLSAMLLTMELDGKISAEHGRYSRTS